MAARLFLLACVACLPTLQAAEQYATASSTVNPVRKVVSLLQMMQKKVTAEGEKEKDLYDKFMCYCKNGAGALDGSISGAETKIPQVGADIKAAESDKIKTEEELKTARADLASAKAAMKEATAMREKEAAAFGAEKADADSNLFAILGRCTVQKPGGEYTVGECSKVGGQFVGAIPALEKGMAGAFLQTSAADVLKRLVLGKQDMFEEDDKKNILAFLSGSSSYAPQSGQILGILKQMADTMNANLAAATSEEEAAIKVYQELMDAKTKEANALQASIESKIKKIGDLAVSIVQMKNDLSETEAALLEDKQFLADLDKSCATKTSEWDERSKTRSEELLALADTIKLLNDDDALELFKKTLPSASASLVQLRVSSDAMRGKALALVREAAGHPSKERARLELIALALAGKKMAAGGFEKVIKMIDDMVKLLKEEQVADDDKKQYCLTQFDNTDDKKKGLERTLSQTTVAIATTEDGIATLTADIAALTADVKALDQEVAEATEQRKEENKAFTEMMASDSAAKELLGIAKNRLNQFYNPKLYKAAPKVELSAEERILVSEGGTASPTPAPGGIAGTGVAVMSQVSAHMQDEVAPPPAPDTWGAYSTKSGESTGVIAMIDLLVKDLTKEMTEGKTTEADAQADYESMMRDSAEKRVTDTQSIADKGGAKAGLEADLAALNSDKAAATSELAATLEYISSLHAECDWLLKYFEVRKEARAGEVDSLVSAKAVLSGADYSLLQKTRGNLRHA